MTVNTPREIVDSYVGLLIMQYLNKPKASGSINTLVSPTILPQTSVQVITFTAAPTSGTYVLSYLDNNSASINWNDSGATIQTKLRAISGLGSVVVTVVSSTEISVTFTGVMPPAYDLVVVSNSLVASATAVFIDIAETDTTIPLAVQDAFNFVPGTTLAQGVQLDVIGKYVGVSRYGYGFTGSTPITLDDADFISLIQMGIIKNQSGSSLYEIQQFLHQFFDTVLYVTDHANMTMTYVISALAGSYDLVQLFVTEGLLPSPMAVQTQVFYVPTANLFSFRTYQLPSANGSPFNDYLDYQTDWPWLSYHNLVI